MTQYFDHRVRVILTFHPSFLLTYRKCQLILTKFLPIWPLSKNWELVTRSGASAAPLPKCKLFTQLEFLKDKVLNRTTVSNIRQASTSQDRTEHINFQPISPDASAPNPSPSFELNSNQSRKGASGQLFI